MWQILLDIWEWLFEFNGLFGNIFNFEIIGFLLLFILWILGSSKLDEILWLVFKLIVVVYTVHVYG